MIQDFTVTDAAGSPWRLADHLDTAAVLTFQRGDFCAYCHGQMAALAERHQDFLDAGARIYALSIDSSPQNAAVMEKLRLPFPILSDPDRSRAIEPLGFSDENDPRQISRPAAIVISPNGEEVFRAVGRDFADRVTENALLGAVTDLGLPSTTQDAPATSDSEAGENAVDIATLPTYYKAAKFAVLALRGRHRDTSEDFRNDTKAYVAMLDRYTEAITAR